MSEIVSIQIYLRTGPTNGAGADMGKSDLFMGNLKLTPDFTTTNEAWYDISAGSGEINVQVSYAPSNVSLLSVEGCQPGESTFPS